MHIFNIDARVFSGYDEYNYFFINNPFSEKIMNDIALKLKKISLDKKKKITVLYQFPFYKKIHWYGIWYFLWKIPWLHLDFWLNSHYITDTVCNEKLRRRWLWLSRFLGKPMKKQVNQLLLLDVFPVAKQWEMVNKKDVTLWKSNWLGPFKLKLHKQVVFLLVLIILFLPVNQNVELPTFMLF